MGNLTKSLLFIIVSLILSTSCGGRQPITIGFAGELTGNQADLGVHGRNGAQLAVETINQAGGVVGRPLKLVVQDDLGTPEGARLADRALVEAGVVAIIGHMTSKQSLAAIPTIEKANVVLLSPTTSTSQLSGRKDLFFRVTSTADSSAISLAHHIFIERGITKTAVILDTDNIGFSQTYGEAFSETYHALGGQVVEEVHFSSTTQPDFSAAVIKLRETGAEGLLIIAAAFDAALIAQQTRLSEWPVPLFASGWSQTEILIQHGGQAVEGLEIMRIYDPNSQMPAFKVFRERYEARFGRTPSFAAAQSYEAVLVLAAALEKTRGRAKGLPEALVKIQALEGLIGPISLDEYGDAARPNVLVRVENGQFVTLANLSP